MVFIKENGKLRFKTKVNAVSERNIRLLRNFYNGYSSSIPIQEVHAQMINDICYRYDHMVKSNVQYDHCELADVIKNNISLVGEHHLAYSYLLAIE